MCAITNDQGKQNPITLYGFDGSTYVRTVRMLLAEKGAQYDQVPVHVLKGEPRQPEHLARHPFGKVPVVDHDGFRILETSAIAPYLDELLPGPSFMPDNAKDRARMRMAIGIINSVATTRWSEWRAITCSRISLAGSSARYKEKASTQSRTDLLAAPFCHSPIVEIL